MRALSLPMITQETAPSEKAFGVRDDWLKARRALPFSSDANDLLYQWEASRDYDPSAGLDRIRAHVLAIKSADDELNPPETGIAERGIAQLANNRLLLIPASEQTRGHGTAGLATLRAGALNLFLR
ncbi:hypothetical protein [Variovorax sp. LjRoot178]|uniref:hypothetical protein n=1 Tax=Variovorax sp. LjRoot178 TaxID=3342277 RepID=UPI003F511487